MNDIDKKVNELIMQEIGLEIGSGNRIFDQDTGDAIRINGMDVVAPGVYGGRTAVEFDPHNNRKMMGQLFGYFINKNSEETGNGVVAFYNVDSDNTSRVECRLDDNSIIKSKNYIRDSLRYTDIIMQLNGCNDEDLKRYDIPSEKKNIKKGRIRR